MNYISQTLGRGMLYVKIVTMEFNKLGDGEIKCFYSVRTYEKFSLRFVI